LHGLEDHPIVGVGPQGDILALPGRVHGQGRAHRARAEDRDSCHGGQTIMGAMPGRHLPAAPVPEGLPARAVPSRLDYPLLALGVVAVSFSAVLIRWAHAPGLSVALYRVAIASALVVPPALLRHRDELLKLTRRQILLAVGSGAMLAVHFATWIPSLSYTTVAASVVLVTTQPVWTALAGRALGERMRPAALA